MSPSKFSVFLIKSLPQNPLTSVGLDKPVFNLLTDNIKDKFSPFIQEELEFYKINHHELEDVQDGEGIGNMLDFIKNTENLEGDILELGVYKGGSTIMIARFLKKLGSKKKIYACDSFAGLPYDDKFSYTKNAKGMFSDSSANIVKKKFKKFNVDEGIVMIEGLFEDTLYKKLADEKFSFVFVDCDLYDATKFSLDFVFPRLAKGGIVLFDEYDRFLKDSYEWGETRAVDEFCEANNIKVNLDPLPHLKK